jgi:thymidylate synthase (FAD)
MDEVAYLRPPGIYMNRQGARFEYTDAHRRVDLNIGFQLVCRYHSLLSEGCPEEQARSVLMFDYRQHFVVSFNLRSLMHALDLRAKADAQLEIQALSELLMGEFEKWTPEVAQWYRQKRFGKARLAP